MNEKQIKEERSVDGYIELYKEVETEEDKNRENHNINKSPKCSRPVVEAICGVVSKNTSWNKIP
jgi:hypothetical protein